MQASPPPLLLQFEMQSLGPGYVCAWRLLYQFTFFLSCTLLTASQLRAIPCPWHYIPYNKAMAHTTLFIDLDDTLYPNTNGLWASIRDRMTDFMHQRLNLPLNEVHQLRRNYFETYGTTLRGLQLHHQIDADEYLAYVHNLPLEKFLTPDPSIRALLVSLPQQKWIFTNADEAHAQRVLNVLELADCFAGIIDVRALDYACKPQVDAYHQALKISGEADPYKCIMLDDSIRNLVPAGEMGITTVLVGVDEPHPSVHHTIRSMHNLPEVITELRETDNGNVGI